MMVFESMVGADGLSFLSMTVLGSMVGAVTIILVGIWRTTR